MRQCFTISGFFSQRVTGAQRCGREIVAELDRLLQDDRLKSSFSAKIIAPAGSELGPALRAIAFERTAGGGGPLWHQFVLPFATQGVLLSLCNMGPLFASNHIVCIHDLNIILAPESYSSTYRTYHRIMGPFLARHAAQVVTVSHFSARMLNDFGFRRLDQITVIPNGHEHVRRWQPHLWRHSAMDPNRRPFIFVLGSRARHKNVDILFSIAKEIDALGLDIFVAGPSGKGFSTLEMDSVPSNVRILGFVTDDDLAALYQNALCFAFPSLTEGFGLPVLEALAFGCTVVASNAASLPEVCGDAALYADPKSPRDWLDQIKRLRAEPNLSQILRAEGPRQAMRFSWAKSAQLYLDLIMRQAQPIETAAVQSALLASSPGCTSSRSIEIEFSLALNNRTGKYFVCRDLIEAVDDLTENIWYWRIRSAAAPCGLTARILGRLMTAEYVTRIGYPALDAALGRRWRASPMLFTDPLQVLFYRLKSSDIILCHDVGTITHPQLYADGVKEAYAKVFKEVREARPHMLFVSRSAQGEFHRLYGNEYASSSVVYPPIRQGALSGELEPVAVGKFLLTVGAVGSRKNQAMCSRAFQRSGLADQGVSYVICGGPEPGYDDVVTAARSVGNVLFTGYVTDSQLRWLYAHATGFVLPSLLEGFGFPAAEAIAAGVVPLITKGGALHEITGNGAVLVDPTDIDSIVYGMRELVELGDDERKGRLTALQRHIRQFTSAAAVAGWRSCVQGSLGGSGAIAES